jgi:hypothetical protein
VAAILGEPELAPSVDLTQATLDRRQQGDPSTITPDHRSPI